MLNLCKKAIHSLDFCFNKEISRLERVNLHTSFLSNIIKVLLYHCAETILRNVLLDCYEQSKANMKV